MKKILMAATCALLLTSCFRTKLYVGNVRKADPIVEVGQEPMNAHFVAGLVAGRNATVETAEHVNDAENYVVQTNLSFVDLLIGSVTFGIYTPTQTKFYIKTDEIGKSVKND